MTLGLGGPRAHRTLCESVFEDLPVGLVYCKIMYDAHGNAEDGVYLKANKHFLKSTGLTHVAGKRITEIFPRIHKTNPDLFETCDRVSSTGVPEQFELYGDTLEKWYLVSAYSPKRNFIVCLFHDLTEQKRVEKYLTDAKIAARNVLEDLQVEKEALARSIAKDEAILSSIGDGLITTDTDGKIVLVNKTFEKTLGLKLSDIRGKSLSEAIVMTDKSGNIIPREERLIERFFKKKGSELTTATTVQYYKKSDETIFPVRITLAPILLENEFLGVVEVFHDIKKEIEIDRAKTEFISLASHQLKTPLTSMCWNTELLMTLGNGRMPEQIYTYVKKIFLNNQKLVALTEALLNVSRIEMGTLAAAPRPIRLTEIINGIFEELSQTILFKKLQIQRHFQQDLPIINADPQFMRIILQNLIVNAVKYSFKKGVISISMSIQNEDHLRVTVSDHGCGIPKAQQSNVFSKSFRADNAKEMHSDGSGLGLYIAKALIEQSNGKIWFESVENQGSHFYLGLPLS